MVVTAVEQLRDRVLTLDVGDPTTPEADVATFIDVLVAIGSHGDDSEPAASPPEADRILAGCALLRRLRRALSPIVDGPLDRANQFWIEGGKPSHMPPGIPTLDERHFVSIEEAPLRPAVKPFYVGLFTSTGFLGTQGMWRAYLDQYEGNAVPRAAWHVWHLDVQASARVREVTTATGWHDFVREYPNESRGLVYPDWAAASRDFDGVHLTVAAIAAAQGFRLCDGQTPTAALYWDVESTLWLRWSFTTVQLVEIVPAVPHGSTPFRP